MIDIQKFMREIKGHIEEAEGHIESLTSKVADTGWQEIVLPSDTTVRQYLGTGDMPRYRRIGSVVTVTGELSPNSDYTGSKARLLAFNLPDGYRPSRSISQMSQGTGVNLFAWYINPNGTVSWERYRAGATYAKATKTAWLPITISFITDDDFPSIT